MSDKPMFGKHFTAPDIILISDGWSPPYEIPKIKEAARQNDTKILGVGIGTPLNEWCDESHTIWNLEDIGRSAEEMLFKSTQEER